MYFTNLHLQKVRVISDKKHANNRGKEKKRLPCASSSFHACSTRVSWQKWKLEDVVLRIIWQDLTECTHWGAQPAIPGLQVTNVPRRHAVCSGVIRVPFAITTFAALGWITLLNSPIGRAWVVPILRISSWVSTFVSPPVSFPMFSREPLLRMNLPGHFRCARLMGER